MTRRTWNDRVVIIIIHKTRIVIMVVIGWFRWRFRWHPTTRRRRVGVAPQIRRRRRRDGRKRTDQWRRWNTMRSRGCSCKSQHLRRGSRRSATDPTQHHLAWMFEDFFFDDVMKRGSCFWFLVAVLGFLWKCFLGDDVLTCQPNRSFWFSSRNGFFTILSLEVYWMLFDKQAGCVNVLW